jgi:hypothetical protein
MHDETAPGRARREELLAEIAALERAVAAAEDRLMTARDEADTAELRAADRRLLRWMLFTGIAVFGGVGAVALVVSWLR